MNSINRSESFIAFFERAIHDLSSNLHVIQFCVDELKEKNHSEKLLTQLDSATSSCVEKIKLYRQFINFWQKNGLSSENEGIDIDDFVELLKISLSVAKDSLNVSFNFRSICQKSKKIDLDAWFDVIFFHCKELKKNSKKNELNIEVNFENESEEKVFLSLSIDEMREETSIFKSSRNFKDHFLFDSKMSDERFLLTIAKKA